MSKQYFPIQWHKDMLERHISALNNDFKRLKELQNIYIVAQARADFYHLQINTAIKQKRSSFDQGNFLKKEWAEKLEQLKAKGIIP